MPLIVVISGFLAVFTVDAASTAGLARLRQIVPNREELQRLLPREQIYSFLKSKKGKALGLFLLAYLTLDALFYNVYLNYDDVDVMKMDQIIKPMIMAHFSQDDVIGRLFETLGAGKYETMMSTDFSGKP